MSVSLFTYLFSQEDSWVGGKHWKIKDIVVIKHVTIFECCPEPYPTLVLSIHLKRDSPSFTAIISIPALGNDI